MALQARKLEVRLERAGPKPVENRAAIVLKLRELGIVDHDFLEAFEKVPRHLFVEPTCQADCGDDISLPLPCGQSTLAPSTMALMVAALRLQRHNRVLDVGCGTGYQAAILSRLCQRVVTQDRFRTLLDIAEERFSALGLANIVCVQADGHLGYPRYAPFDGIIVSGGVTEVPHALVEQLSEGGRLVLPLIEGYRARIVRLTKAYRRVEGETIGVGRFQPLIAGVAERL